MNPFRLKYIEVFQALMETGSTHGAAAALHTTQPSVSKALAAFERQLGFALFLRTGTGLKPTADAYALMADANRVNEEVFNFQKAAGALRDGRSHQLTVQASPTLTSILLPEAVARYKDRWSEGKICLNAGGEHGVANAVRNFAADVGIVLSGPTDTYGHIRRLHSSPMVCVMPVNHPLAALDVVRPPDLAGQKIVGYRHNLALQRMIECAFSEEYVQQDIDVTANYTTTICKIVEQGYGLAIVDPYSVRLGLYPGLLRKPFMPECMVHVDLIVSEQRPASVQAEQFLEIVQECLLETVKLQTQ
ncbi:LysR family transcriptional regulator [Herbaspirillum sp. RV1423]|uniref:LysR family transcriptional regulator n=1 Tax=Herbaspirillum sp. RV1423 TaxID=1443993 RepID=UPI000553E638|nr:LysR family transcriptional regulator [Herbaspirillum sp. RV1423]